MGKGEETRSAILAEAVAMASVEGLNGLSIGVLAARTGLSKSGLFAHFGSKEALQKSILQSAIDLFTREVAAPALLEPRGEPRIRAIFTHWLRWTQSPNLPGGCPLMTAAIELDDHPGPLRDFLVATQERWMDFLAHAAEIAIEEGNFRPDLDLGRFAFEFNCILLGYNSSARLLRNPQAEDHARWAFESLLERSRP